MTPREYIEIKSLLVNILNKVEALAAAAQKELMTPAEVCRMLKIGRTTYQRYVEDGILKQVRVNRGRSGKVYVRRADILDLIDGGKL